jgi:DMSO/TMAO reductase YedYZ molybdopterin-dependent catalytic subunit
VTDDFPVLSAGPTPHTPLDRCTLTLQDDGSLVGKWTWEEFQALPRTELTVDIHCVTKWSKLGTVWEGVTIDDLLAAAGLKEPTAPYLMAHCDGGYTTNLPLEDLLDGKLHRNGLSPSTSCRPFPAHPRLSSLAYALPCQRFAETLAGKCA